MACRGADRRGERENGDAQHAADGSEEQGCLKRHGAGRRDGGAIDAEGRDEGDVEADIGGERNRLEPHAQLLLAGHGQEHLAGADGGLGEDAG